MKLFTLFFLLMTFAVKADHYYGGYLTYKHLGGFKYEVTVTTYADNSKVNSDRDSVEVIWGDGSKTFIQRVNNFGNGETVFPGIKKNIYVGEYTYSEDGNYQLVFIDDFRPFDITNISAGRSGSTLLYFDAIVPVGDTLVNCKNNAPSFLTEPFMTGLFGQDFHLSLTHYDVDGDSLSFKLTEPKARNATPVPGYYTPAGASVDSKTGLFSWVNPAFGNYVFAYEIEEYRNGELMGVSTADFPVFIGFNDSAKGAFSAIPEVSGNQYHFNGAGSQDFTVSYTNSNADSVFIEVVTFMDDLTEFSLSSKYNSSNGIAKDTLTVQYLGGDENQGNYIVTFRAGSVYGSDTLFDYKSIAISTNSSKSWNCLVPEDIRDTKEITPIVDVFDITPNLIDETTWINVGEDYQLMKLEVFDMRGRVVYRIDNFESPTVKLWLGNLRPAMYFFRLVREDKIVTVVRGVKR